MMILTNATIIFTLCNVNTPIYFSVKRYCTLKLYTLSLNRFPFYYTNIFLSVHMHSHDKRISSEDNCVPKRGF